MSRRWAVVLVVVSLFTLACEGGDIDPAPSSVPGFPTSMVALGDSLTAGYASCLAPAPCPRNSWATGDGPRVQSHYRRILAANPAIRNRATNLSVPGVLVADLPRQAAAVTRSAGYVTILIGANDACRGEMTSPGAFRARIDEALGALRTAVPRARVLLVGLPNVYRVWELGHTNRAALEVWRAGICPNLLRNASSTATADVARRAAFRERIAAYNTEIAAACAAYGPRCRHADIGRFAFDLTMLSAIDFFHPNSVGQNALASQTYPGTFTW